MYRYFVYVLHCINNKQFYYTGITRDLEKKYLEHKRGQVELTRPFNGNLSICYLEKIEARTEKMALQNAFHRIEKIKKYGKEKKQQVIKLHEKETALLLSNFLYSRTFTM